MSEKEKSSSNETRLDRGGCTVFGDSIAPTLVRNYYKMVGTTQDELTIVILGEEDERKG